MSRRNVRTWLLVLLAILLPVAALQERLKNDKRRPLLQVPDRRRVIAGLYGERVPLYRAAADLVIEGGAPAVVVAKRVAERFQAAPPTKNT